ncbi:LPS export ABC transporter periplasmic protein LptC [Palleronia sp. LCG004]|uniref:LPS export ABC transporter periplasmic protein LptC n=1 Tax=Palleronia sp. LCG004 TaxID=3079304 RepID=UPI0029437852|nr:LPS export ABC transporter periplasmic protein LptC [Palleronia sp. LCG004]WOI55997.1 hypothetical protein RVY76_13295 [Palleronia sp. LCG004]
MAVYDNRHSRRVALLKVILPLLALAILSTLFLVADRRGTGDTVPFSSVEIDRIAAGQQIAGPNYTTVTEDGSALTLAARDVASSDGVAELRDIIAVIEYSDGTRIDLTSDTGNLGSGEGAAQLVGGVALGSSNGYRIEGSAFDISRATGRIVSDAPVRGEGPPGTLDAGGLTVDGRDGNYVLNFTDGVKLLYQPRGQDEE